MNDELKLKEGINTGVIEKMPVLGNFVAGAETGVSAIEHLATGDWRPYLPTDEKQLLIVNMQSYLETNSCVSFSAHNELEGFTDLVVSSWPVEVVQWLRDNGYFDENGKINFSDRFTSKMSGTDPNRGNSLPAVWDSIRNNGVVPEKDWPMPVEEMKALIAKGGWTMQDVQNLYFAEIPQALKDKAKEFKKRFEVQYEWIKYPGYGNTDTLRKALKVAPLQIATAVCAGWNTDNPIKACGAGSQHATTLVNVEPDGSFDIYDHYNPFLKHFAADYDITYAMRAVIAPIAQPAPVPPFKYTFTKQLTYGSVNNDTAELRALQSALQYLKDAKGAPYMKPGVFGPFGPQTRAALDKFQQDNGIIDPQPGQNFGPKTRAVMNKKLAI